MESTVSFENLLSDSSIKAVLHSLHLDDPTPIQEKAIPLILEGLDVTCQSSTGSGKTLAFALPMAEMLSPSNGLQALVLVPTRELCEQVSEECRKVMKGKKLEVLEVFGGVSIDNQIRKVPRAHVVVATPGRLCDLMNRRVIRLDNLKVVVLDEADRMLDMGFIKDVEFILKTTPRKRQTLMFSATLPKGTQHIVNRHMRNPKLVKAKEQVDKNLLKQYYYDVPIRDRFHLLVHLLKHEKAPYAIVFCGTRRAVDLIAYNLNQNGITARAIHGGLTQAMRKQVISSFHEKQTRILVASDIAARGLDIKMLSHVYNFDVPKTAEEYVHRIGRTARAGEDGVAITLVSEKDYDNFRRVLMDRSLKIEKVPVPSVPIVKFSRFVPHSAGHRGHGGRSSGGFRGRGGPRKPGHHSGNFRKGGNARGGQRSGQRGGQRRSQHGGQRSHSRSSGRR